MQKLSVIIPAFNEQDRIKKTLLEVSEFLKNQSFAYEIIVVNDGSKDKTVEVVQSLARDLSNIQVLDLITNYGKGYAVKAGMLKGSGDARLFMDADNSTSITNLNKMLPLLGNKAQVIIGSIEAPGAKINERAQWYRRLLGHWSKYLIRAVAGLWNIKDTQRGFKLFTGLAADEIFQRQTLTGFGFDIEVLAIAKTLNYKILELPVVWDNPPGSTLKLKNYLDVLLDLFVVRFKLWSKAYNQKYTNKSR